MQLYKVPGTSQMQGSRRGLRVRPLRAEDACPRVRELRAKDGQLRGRRRAMERTDGGPRAAGGESLPDVGGGRSGSGSGRRTMALVGGRGPVPRRPRAASLSRLTSREELPCD